jgi:hypothetical protein
MQYGKPSIPFTMKGLPLDETTIDRTAMGRLAKALVFICGADHPAIAALQAAATTGSEKDIKAARTAFLKLKPGDRRAAMTMLDD